MMTDSAPLSPNSIDDVVWTPTPLARKPFRCPICDGCGSVPADFYARTGAGTSTARELCRPCGGSGMVWGLG